MTYATASIDRRADYYSRVADLIALDPLAFYTRAEKGREIQRRIKPKDLPPFGQKTVTEKPTADVVPIRRVVG